MVTQDAEKKVNAGPDTPTTYGALQAKSSRLLICCTFDQWNVPDK